MPLRTFMLLPLIAVGAPTTVADEGDSVASVRAAIQRAIPLLQAGAQGSAEHRKCFTCHNQAVPVFALVEARKRGFSIDDEIVDRQVSHTLAHLKRGTDNYSEGRGQGGGVLTAGYALWTLDVGGQAPDPITDAVAHFLLEDQKTSSRWRHSSSRPPSSDSDFTATFVALRGIAVFSTDEQKAAAESRAERVGRWILEQDPLETEDRVFRLLSMPYIDADDSAIAQATDALVDSQREDGGWAQMEEMESDAYATATALVALQRAGKLDQNDSTVQRGVQYLLDQQLEDGSWHVTTRANPFQTYFESGFPHGKDQFISIAATGWATLALTLTLPTP